MTPPTIGQRLLALYDRGKNAYRNLVVDSGLPGAARSPLLFTGFLVREIIGKELSTRAMALSYQFLFCLVPALTLLLALLARALPLHRRLNPPPHPQPQPLRRRRQTRTWTGHLEKVIAIIALRVIYSTGDSVETKKRPRRRGKATPTRRRGERCLISRSIDRMTMSES